MGRASWVIAAVIVVIVINPMTNIVTEAGSPTREAPAGAEAQDRAAQSDLRNAFAAAKTYFADDDSYKGFHPTVGVMIEPSLSYAGDRTATLGVISINLVTKTEVVMSTVSDSGRAFCIADAVRGSGTTFGRVDAAGARSSLACNGGW
jgi:hypothetical protein